MVRKHIANNDNAPCFLRSHLISNLSHMSCDVSVKSQKRGGAVWPPPYKWTDSFI